MSKVFVINGAPQSGKSTFVSFCLKRLGVWGKEVSTVDFVKEVATMAGWNGEKTPKNRKFLSDLKDLFVEWGDVPFEKVKHELELFESEFRYYGVEKIPSYFFIHCREPKEIQKFVDRLNAKTILIRREEAENLEQSNHADSEVFDFNYDIEIVNNGSLEDLKTKALEFISNF